VAERERLIGEVAALKERGEDSSFVDNARQLLTRWWSTTDWAARERLLKTVAWLLRFEDLRGSQMPLPPCSSPREP
jgi:hypothetical protein